MEYEGSKMEGNAKVVKNPIRVPKDILDRSAPCSKGFSCLDALPGGLCTAKRYCDEGREIVECCDSSKCTFKSQHGFMYRCTCATRIYLLMELRGR